ncbi:MAG: polysaccharide pyruvyl transferase family protein [Clostridia bacterium]|nr:polysaccharide pyruvyl transferase family protein [Clostridia bacterium]
MKKIRISTLIGDYNYGNRLQNYALSKKISDMGFEVKTLNYKYTKKNVKVILKNMARNILINLNIGRFKREKNFKQFNKNIHFTKSIYIDDTIDTRNVDYFITGSDQVWNYNFDTFSDRDFLLFSEYSKNISYAASFGFDKVPSDKITKYQKGLTNIKYISVRETSGVGIVKDMANRDSIVVIDPTLLLTKNEWRKLEKKPTKHLLKDYILVHILGDSSIDIELLKKELGLDIIQINNKNQSCYYNCGPSEYLYLVNNAKMIITDSYHACIFSIIYKKPFFVYDRIVNGNMYMQSRIDTLLKLFSLENQKIKDISEILKRSNIFEIDTSSYDETLSKENIKATLFLNEALNIK